MQTRALLAATAAVVTIVSTVAGCTSGSSGTDTSTPSATVTDTVTATATATGSASSANPPTGSGVPATGTTTASGGGGSASGPGLCTPTVMTFRVGQGGGAAGTFYVPIIATNASEQPCVTTGYPGVAALNAAGTQIAQAQRETAQGATTLVVQPGQQISALLSGVSTGPDGSRCPTAPAILFTLPDNTDSTRLVVGFPACVRGVGVRAFVRGTTGGL